MSPIASFVVSLDLDGRVASHGSFAEVLGEDHAIATTVAKEVGSESRSSDDSNTVLTEAETGQHLGKLIAAEEIAQGHVSWETCESIQTLFLLPIVIVL